MLLDLTVAAIYPSKLVGNWGQPTIGNGRTDPQLGIGSHARAPAGGPRERRQSRGSMIVCSCNVITRASIDRAVEQLGAGPEPGVVTPGCVYRALGKRPQCGTCLRTVSRLIQGNETSQRRSRHGQHDR